MKEDNQGARGPEALIRFHEPKLVSGPSVSFTQTEDAAVLSVIFDSASIEILESASQRRSSLEIAFSVDVEVLRDARAPIVFADTRGFISRSGSTVGAIEVRIGRSRRVRAFGQRERGMERKFEWQQAVRIRSGTAHSIRRLPIFVRLSGTRRGDHGELNIAVESMDLDSRRR
jgi:hypothetical protein